MKRILILAALLVMTFSAHGQQSGSSSNDDNKQKVLSPSLKFLLPIKNATVVPGTPITPIQSYSTYKNEYGKLSGSGVGFGIDARIHQNIHPFLEGIMYKYKQELAEEGMDVHYNDAIGMPFMMNLPNGAKYIAETNGIKLGLKYVITKNEKYQPWIGAAYGFYFWKISYSGWNEETLYGLDKGMSKRFTYRLGLDIKVPELITLTLYLDANAPVADYTMDNLFIVGKTEHVFDGHVFPVLSLGICAGLY